MSDDGWQRFCTLLRSTQSRAELGALLREMLTPHEQRVLVERCRILDHLAEGMTQRDVQKTLHVGIATVSRGARLLRYGDGVYQRVRARSLRPIALAAKLVLRRPSMGAPRPKTH